MNPKYIMVVRRDAEKKYFLVSIRLSNEPGALSQVSKVLAIRDMNILEGFTCTTNKERHAVWSFIAESRNPRMDAKFIRSLLEESEFVEKIEIEESHGGLIVDSLNFPLVWGGGARCVVLSADFIVTAFENAKSAFGEEQAHEFIYQLGLTYGRERWNAVFGGTSENIESALREATKLLSAAGMARGEMVMFDPKLPLVTLSLEDNFECTSTTTPGPRSHFVRGTICGAVSAAFNQDLRAVETECIANGDKKCTIVVSKA